MASIRLRGRSYFCEVCRNGHRKSASFRTLHEARAWGKIQEEAIDAKVAPWRLGPDPLGPADFVTTDPGFSELVLSESEILGKPRFRLSCGIYFLIKHDEVVYVGQSTTIHSRVLTHRACWKDFDSYTYIPCAIDQLNDLERYYIRLLKPCLNIAGNR